VVSGGTSVNSIPFEVSMEVDMRSVSPDELKKIDAQLHRIVDEAVAEENTIRKTTFGKITAEMKMIGERPSGVTPPNAPELRQVSATMAVFDKVPLWETSSTDANIPISLGIPAFAMASQSATRGGRSHSLDEWTDVDKPAAVKDFSLALAVILSVADVPSS
jgi:acetylornithine deacetylase/succinyl-diaminopimelate desuccinylase-like protein